VITVEFFDDFTQLEPLATSESSLIALEGLLQVLGWQVSLGDKRLPFEKSFATLGVVVDLSRLDEQLLVLRNKEGRVAGIIEAIDEFLVGNKLMGFKEALSLRGRLAYAEGQTFGKILASTTHILSQWVKRKGSFLPDPELLSALAHAKDYLASAGPRIVRPQVSDRPVIVFTDGACEDRTTIGGVLFDGDLIQCFGAVVPPAIVNSWKSSLEQSQVIGQAEIFPVLVAKLTWASILRGRKAVYFLDNESARIALVRSYSPVLTSLKLVMSVAKWDYQNLSDSWYARVPTCANISDGPSRMSLEEMSTIGTFKVVVPLFPDGQPDEYL
jgi:hypothetical protein